MVSQYLEKIGAANTSSVNYSAELSFINTLNYDSILFTLQLFGGLLTLIILCFSYLLIRVVRKMDS